VQAEILDLLRDIQRERVMALLLITHDWGVVADICDRVVVMYEGEVIEAAEINAVFHQPFHPYTRALLSSNPHHSDLGSRLDTIPGTVPKPGAWPEGCHFHPRCGYSTSACTSGSVSLEERVDGRLTRCLRYDVLVRPAIHEPR
jgi:peptide/nickel transport system permease protein